jgi:DNA polymerase III subunit delta'
MSDSTPQASLAPWLQLQLSNLLARRGHAWLLQGPSGLGQYDLALELARAWLCENPSATGACGHCHSCHAVDVRTHPDLCVLMPETLSIELNWPLDEKAQKDIDDKKRKASKEIRVEAAREMVTFTQHTRSGGRTKVVLIYPAERMNHVTANTILKTLEEPPGETRFVLASEASHQLLPTIRSRCQTHAMHWPDEAQSLEWLTAQGLRPEEAVIWLRASGGRPQDALKLPDLGLKASDWSAFPQMAAKGSLGKLVEATPAQVIDALQKLCHDCLAVLSGASPRFFSATDLPTSNQVPLLTQWGKELMQQSRSAEHPFNAGLMLEALASQAHMALRTKN